MLALAFLVPLAAGVYDLSVGAMMSLALAISVYLSLHSGLSPAVGALIALLACALCGFVSGFVVVRLHVNSFIATLTQCSEAVIKIGDVFGVLAGQEGGLMGLGHG